MATTQTVGSVESASTVRNTQREYESVTILRPEASKPEVSELIRRMQAVFNERGGSLLKIDSWGIRILAYPIRRQRKGLYLYWRFLGGSDMVAEFERHMRLLDKVIRFYTIRVDDNVDPNARPSEVTDDLVESVSEPGPDPDEVRRAAEEAARTRHEQDEAAHRERARERESGDGSGDNDDSGNDAEAGQ